MLQVGNNHGIFESRNLVHTLRRFWGTIPDLVARFESLRSLYKNIKGGIKMRRYYMHDVDDTYTLVVGTDREIRSLYTRLERHGFYPTFTNFPKFRYGGMYGITIEKDGWYQVINSDTVVRFLIDINRG